MNEFRKKSPEPVDPEEFARVANPGDSAEEIVTKQDRSERMKSAMDELTPDHRAVLELTFYQGMSYQEIADVMDCPVNTVKTRMYYAKEKLKEALAKYGISQGRMSVRLIWECEQQKYCLRTAVAAGKTLTSC